MAIYSKFEINIIDKLLKIHDRDGLIVFGNLLEYEFNSDYKLDFETAHVFVKVEDFNKYGGSIIFKIEKLLIELSTLVMDLIENKYLIEVSDNNNKNNIKSYGTKLVGTKYGDYPISDIPVINFLSRTIGKKYYPTHKLYELQGLNYLSYDELERQNTNKNLKIATKSIWIAIASLVISIILGIINIFQQYEGNIINNRSLFLEVEKYKEQIKK